MKVGVTGWNGFLASKLRQRNGIEWTEDIKDCDILFLLGSPTYTSADIDKQGAQVMHRYVNETIKIIDAFSGPVVFASSTGVDDIQLDHTGSTSYNLAKLYLENYVINHCDQWAILRIGTIISKDPDDIAAMKSDRIQPRVKSKDLSNIEWQDYYLYVDDFVNTTVDLIKNFKTGIVEYPLVRLTLTELAKL
jgi:nucleoside-diphosphate-sugar epimerase